MGGNSLKRASPRPPSGTAQAPLGTVTRKPGLQIRNSRTVGRRDRPAGAAAQKSLEGKPGENFSPDLSTAQLGTPPKGTPPRDSAEGLRRGTPPRDSAEAATSLSRRRKRLCPPREGGRLRPSREGGRLRPSREGGCQARRFPPAIAPRFLQETIFPCRTPDICRRVFVVDIRQACEYNSSPSADVPPISLPVTVAKGMKHETVDVLPCHHCAGGCVRVRVIPPGEDQEHRDVEGGANRPRLQQRPR